ncbi:very short patch repair endonuclease [Pedobacter cryoconitis]|uniref:T/G mismatch-specific endonuclease n=1 Tax=Pedobacter cryoconitis TaxID=188932 RepID=A0A327RZX1_9SPHI|nr:very short patch repair endonuclease [Pedobacter cryoconitis]RAJ20993.1 T/G mismatch-specific endonuclease [Pedobacter cryoconitis]
MDSKEYKNHDEIIKVPRFTSDSGFHTNEHRSINMSKIKAKNSAAEMLLRKALWAKGIRYRVHVNQLIGKPDLVIKKYHLVIFIDGSFWHGYQWDKKRLSIKDNKDFWIPKIERNMQRDNSYNEILKSKGYTVMRFWDHDVKKRLDACINQIMLYLEAAKNGKIPVSE